MVDHELKRRLSHHVRRLRGEQSFSEIARRTGTDPRTIQMIERGERMPGLGLAQRLAECFGVTIDDLLSPTSKKTAVSA